MCLSKIINIADTCISLSYWPNYFKVSTTIIIPKPNKLSYDSPKAFRPIVLLNTLGKLIEKVIAERLQFIVASDEWRASNNFVHLSQLGGLKSKSTTDAGVVLTHIVRSGWTKGRNTSTLAFDIAQFFPSLNYHFLIRALKKAGLNPKVSNFFASYLIQRSTKYLWNNLSSPSFDINVGVGQGSALSPILSTLYISPLLYILENRFKNLNIPISILSFVDDGLFIVQDKSFLSSNSHLFCGYNILSNLLDRFGLVSGLEGNAWKCSAGRHHWKSYWWWYLEWGLVVVETAFEAWPWNHHRRADWSLLTEKYPRMKKDPDFGSPLDIGWGREEESLLPWNNHWDFLKLLIYLIHYFSANP